MGLAVGASLGMPARRLTRAQVRARWGEVTWFAAGPPAAEYTAGAPPGTVPDDAALALLVAAELGRGLDEPAGERGAPYGPLTERLAGVLAVEGAGAGRADRRPQELAEQCADHGPAVRVAPVGIACGPDPVAGLVALVEAVDRPTHDTGLAHAGAAAIACAVSGAIEGMPADQALSLALAAAADGGLRGRPTPGADVGARIAWACGLARAAADPLEVIDLLVGTSAAAQESVPAAFAIAAIHDDPWAGCLAAAGLGGESAAIAAMVGAMLGARHGLSAFPAQAVAAVEAANPGLDLIGVADAVYGVRRAAVPAEVPR